MYLEIRSIVVFFLLSVAFFSTEQSRNWVSFVN